MKPQIGFSPSPCSHSPCSCPRGMLLNGVSGKSILIRLAHFPEKPELRRRLELTPHDLPVIERIRVPFGGEEQHPAAGPDAR